MLKNFPVGWHILVHDTVARRIGILDESMDESSDFVGQPYQVGRGGRVWRLEGGIVTPEVRARVRQPGVSTLVVCEQGVSG